MDTITKTKTKRTTKKTLGKPETTKANNLSFNKAVEKLKKVVKIKIVDMKAVMK